MKAKFEKFYNRSMPLLSVEYWYRGERYKLSEVTNNAIRWNPLFVYKKGKATDVYYDLNDPQTWEEPLISYFKNHPRKFRILSKDYENECNNLLRLSKQAKIKDFSKIFNLHLSFWPKLSMVIILGELVGQDELKQISQEAYNLRQKTDRVEYLSGDNLMNLARQILPSFKNFIDVLTLEEIISKNIPSRKELAKRKKQYIYFEGNIYTGLGIKQFEKLKNITILKQTSRNIKDSILVLRGMTAMMGKVKGRVKKIFEFGQINKVKKGDILVTPMTTPDFIMAMQKASAFVTDEGGLTCHAAIVAREMKKPCIIGTKIATQTLNDGDIIEVDADRGVVKIIKRKQNSGKTSCA